eukprot:1833682-Pleurochrysis_carterae.AAC.1
MKRSARKMDIQAISSRMARSFEVYARHMARNPAWKQTADSPSAGGRSHHFPLVVAGVGQRR